MCDRPGDQSSHRRYAFGGCFRSKVGTCLSIAPSNDVRSEHGMAIVRIGLALANPRLRRALNESRPIRHAWFRTVVNFRRSEPIRPTYQLFTTKPPNGTCDGYSDPGAVPHSMPIAMPDATDASILRSSGVCTHEPDNGREKPLEGGLQVAIESPVDYIEHIGERIRGGSGGQSSQHWTAVQSIQSHVGYHHSVRRIAKLEFVCLLLQCGSRCSNRITGRIL